MSFSIKRLAGVAVVATGLSVATYAFTAGNTVEASKAGSGSAGITGYDVTDVDYVLNAADPTKIDSVSFALDGVSTTVQVRFGTGAWFGCDVDTAGTAATCDTTDAAGDTEPLVADVAELTVVAAD